MPHTPLCRRGEKKEEKEEKTLYPVIAIRKALIYHKKNLQGIKTQDNFNIARTPSLSPPYNLNPSIQFTTRILIAPMDFGTHPIGRQAKVW